MKRPAMERFSDFMAGKGFYIVLLLCVGALGVSGWFLFNGGGGEPDNAMANAQASVMVTARPTASALPTAVPPATATPRPVPTTAPTARPTPAPAATERPMTATASVFTWPVKGEVLRAWSVEALSYDATMGDWRTHDGVDIAADQGTDVLAPAGGTVSAIVEDDLMGVSVSIAHADGVVSTCASMASVPAIEVGDQVRTGDVIGMVGSTAIAESGEGSHLHLSMLKNGVSVDPLGYLPER